MSVIRTMLALIIFLVTFVAAQTVEPVRARPGDVATGIVQDEKPDGLLLATKPCEGDQKNRGLVYFTQPYNRHAAQKTLYCPDGRSFNNAVTVEQR